MTQTVLPAVCEWDRWFVEPVTASGERLRLYTDTGGGLFLCPEPVARLDLEVEVVELDGSTYKLVALPTFRSEATIPPVVADTDPRPDPLRGRLLVLDESPQFDVGDGLLGQVWFGGRVWTFDYQARRLSVSAATDEFAAGTVSCELGFLTDADDRRVNHFPSVVAIIDGEPLPFLFDTGATVRLTPSARAELGGGPSDRGTCFIVASIFDRWRRVHPDWQVVDHADANADGESMILVPTVTVAGLDAGPVWFTRRAKSTFHEFMSGMMDRRVDGALGGSFLKYFTVTVDYPNARAYFAKHG